MTQKEYYDFREEDNTRQVSLIRLIRGAMKNWKLILLSGLILGALFGCYKIFSIRSNKAAMIEEYDNYEAKLQAYRTSVKDYKKSIADYQASIADLSDYCENSPKMKLDTYHCPTSTADLKVSAPEGGSITQEVINSIKTAIYNEVYYGNSLNDVAAKNNMTVSDLRELVTVKLETSGSSIRLTVIADSEEAAEAMREDILTAIESKHQAFAAASGAYSLKVFNKGTMTITDTTLQNYQQKQQDLLAKLQTTCYTAQNQSLQLVKPVSVPKYSKKYMLMNGIKLGIVGFVGGVVLAMIAFMFLIIREGKILTPDEIDGEYGLRTLADFSGSSAEKQKEEAGYVIARIENAIGDRGSAKIGVVGTVSDKMISALAALLNGKAEEVKAAFRFVEIPGLMTDAKALKDLGNVDGVILSEEIGKSDYMTVRKEVAIVAESGNEIIGTVYF